MKNRGHEAQGMLRTPRLLLREWRETDLAPFAALNADPRVTEHFTRRFEHADTVLMMERLREHFDEHRFGMWAVEVPGVADFIGFTGLVHMGFETSFTPAVEIGWRLAHEHWGRGYATEAARAALRYGFEHLGLGEIVAYTTPANARSRRVMDKLGMRYDPAHDFDHPRAPEGHPNRRHVLYRISAGTPAGA